jgi:hypothetical protein
MLRRKTLASKKAHTRWLLLNFQEFFIFHHDDKSERLKMACKVAGGGGEISDNII